MDQQRGLFQNGEVSPPVLVLTPDDHPSRLLEREGSSSPDAPGLAFCSMVAPWLIPREGGGGGREVLRGEATLGDKAR